MDVDAYLKRIGYEGPKEVTPNTLKNLHVKHVSNVPFDTLDMYGGTRKILDLERIYNNVVSHNRGGVCYELNGLFCWLLRELGFTVHMLNGMAFVETEDAFKSDFDHMVLLVEFSSSEEWIVDVGWGGTSIIYPLKFEDLKEHKEITGIYRVRCVTKDTYYFEKRRQKLIDDEQKEYEYKPSIHQVKDWQLYFKFDLTPHTFDEFEEECSRMQDGTTGFLSQQWLLIQQSSTGRHALLGRKYLWKEYIDPLTIKSVCKYETTDEEMYEIIKKKFNITINFKLIDRKKDNPINWEI